LEKTEEAVLEKAEEASEELNKNSESKDEPADQIDPDLADALNTNLGNSFASNNWVIHGNYTETGKPLLSSDPHLQNSIPSFWTI